MAGPLVSIVIPTHNRRRYIPLTMKSVLAQGYKPVEVVVVDDGSTDGTREWLESLGERITLLTQVARGVAAARNVAVRAARGDFIAFQDDDDLMPPDRIATLLALLHEHPEAVLATGDYEVIDEYGHSKGERWFPLPKEGGQRVQIHGDGQEAILWPRVPAVPHTTLFRRSDGERAGWFDESFRYACSDADFLARLGKLGAVVHVPKIVSHYRRGHRALWKDEIRANYSRLQLWLKHLEDLPTISPLRQRLLTRMSRACGIIAFAWTKGNATFDPQYQVYFERALKELSPWDRYKNELAWRSGRASARVTRLLMSAGQ